MPDRRRVAAKAIIAAGAYLHPNFYVGDQDKKLWQIQSDAPIADLDANFLESWMWAKHPLLAAAIENAIFEAFEDTTRHRVFAVSDRRERDGRIKPVRVHRRRGGGNCQRRAADLYRRDTCKSRSIIVNYANSVLVLPLEGICPFQEISGKGLEAESSLRIIDCPCQLKGTASVRA